MNNIKPITNIKVNFISRNCLRTNGIFLVSNAEKYQLTYMYIISIRNTNNTFFAVALSDLLFVLTPTLGHAVGGVDAISIDVVCQCTGLSRDPIQNRTTFYIGIFWAAILLPKTGRLAILLNIKFGMVRIDIKNVLPLHSADHVLSLSTKDHDLPSCYYWTTKYYLNISYHTILVSQFWSSPGSIWR